MRVLRNIVVAASRTVSLALLIAPLMVALALPLTSQAEEHAATASTNKPFSSMAIESDQPKECSAPRPPRELAPTAYVRNGYRAILRIMAAERWMKTKSCTCFLTQIPWDEVILQSGEFKTSDDDRRPFDVSDLRLRADALLAERDEACAE